MNEQYALCCIECGETLDYPEDGDDYPNHCEVCADIESRLDKKERAERLDEELIRGRGDWI